LTLFVARSTLGSMTLAFSRVGAAGASVALLTLAALPNACDSDNANTSSPDASVVVNLPDGSGTPPVDGGSGTCTKHLPAGFTNAAPIPATDTETAHYGDQVSMVLDENDDPMFAFLSGASDKTKLWFTRWDPCAGAFTAPVQIDALANGVNTNPGERNVGIAYDLSTKEIGIAYNQISPGNSVGDGSNYVSLATQKAGTTTWAIQHVSTYLNPTSSTSAPTIAMGGGVIYLAYTQTNYNCGPGGSCVGIQFVTSQATPPTGYDGGAAAYYFGAQVVNFAGTPVQPRNRMSLALDSNGKAGLAFFQLPATGYNTVEMYWHDGMSNAVVVTDSKNTQDDFVAISLQFEGTKPRIVANLPTSVAPTSNLFFESSTDGTTWAAPIAIPEDNGARNDATALALVFDGNGNALVVTDHNGGTGKCALPFVAQTTNDGAAWNACVSDYAAGTSFTIESVNAAYGQSRIKGKYLLGFQNSETDTDPKAPNGVWVYQSP
jgi:hypothetical protein